jgi:hypothetical protein
MGLVPIKDNNTRCATHKNCRRVVFFQMTENKVSRATIAEQIAFVYKSLTDGCQLIN